MIMNGPPELALEVLGVEAGTQTPAPALRLRLGLRRADGGPVQCVLLTATVTAAAAGLSWARVGATVPTFRGGTELTLALPCGPRLRVAAQRHRHALSDGDVPLDLAFDGTVFYPGEDGTRRTGQAPWRHETTALLPVRTWRDLMGLPDLRARRTRGAEAPREAEGSTA